MPFPAPVDTSSREERFRLEEVADWLERTGRGNNADVRGDAPAFASLPDCGVSEHDQVVGVTALLALRSATGASLAGVDASNLLDLADTVDPDDEFLYTEVDRLFPDARVALAKYVDDLVTAAYGVSPALDVLTRRANTGLRSELAPVVHDLVGRVVPAVARQLDLAAVRVMDATGHANDLVDDAVRALGEDVDVEVVAGRRGAAIRELRRIAAIRGWAIAGEAAAEPAIVLARLPDADPGDVAAAATLTALDDVQLGLTERQRALVLGPAWLLCDALADPLLERHRDHMIRLGRLRAVVRLPAGLVPARSRQPVGLWLLGPESTVPLEDKAITTADLTDVALTAEVLDDLVTDLLASLDPRQLGRRHAYRFARVLRTSNLLAGRGPLVPAGVAPEPVRPPAGAQAVLAARGLLDLVRKREPTLLSTAQIDPTATPRHHREHLTVAEAQAAGLVRVFAGTRIAEELPHGPARLVGAPELTSDPHAGVGRGADPLALELAHPRAVKSQPGDVLFVVAPRPRAWVDRDGGSVAQWPARVLRCTKGSGLVPEAVAHAVNALPARAQRWQGWHLPVVDPPQADSMSAALVAVAEAEAAARRHLRDLHQLAQALVEGAASHSLAVTTKER